MDLSKSLGLEVLDSELQSEASNILSRVDATLNNPSETVMQFFNDLIFASTEWLVPFRERSGLPPSSVTTPFIEDVDRASEQTLYTPNLHPEEFEIDNKCPAGGLCRSTRFQNDSNCYRTLTRQLSKYVTSTMSPRTDTQTEWPMDHDMSREAGHQQGYSNNYPYP